MSNIHLLFLQGYISNTQYDFVDIDGWADDTLGHGTFVAGIVVDAMQKLNINIIPVRVIGGNNEFSVYLVAQGILQAVAAGADVINVSLGYEIDKYNHEVIHSAIDSAIENNVVIVTTAGNDSGFTEDKCPAHLDAPIVVSGIDKNGAHCGFSNKGQTVDVTVCTGGKYAETGRGCSFV